MTRLWWILSLLLLSLVVGCGDGGGTLGDDDDSAADDDDDDDTTGDDDDSVTDDDDDDSVGDDDDAVEVASVVAVHPQDGTPDHYIGESLRVDFDLAAEDAVVLLTTGNDDSGEVIGGEQLWLTETRLRFSPTGLLEPNTAYTAVVTWAEGAETYSWGFTTGDTGSIPVAADMVGNTYSLAVADGTVVAPAGAEDLLGQFDATFLLGVVSQSATELELLGSTAGEGGMLDQNLCLPTFDLSEKAPTLWTDPYFAGGPTDFSQTLDIPNLGALPLTFRDLEMTGVFVSSDGVTVDEIVEATFAAYVNIQELGLDCSLLAGFVPGLACSACPNDPSSNQCVVFDVIDIPGFLVPDVTLVERTEQDIKDDPNCD